MQIKKLKIDQYGGLSDKEFFLHEGMNIFEGNNESGKSTILGFIRFMLFGMPRKSAGNVTERDRGIHWTCGVAGGSMELSVPDKQGQPREYRIERRGQLRGSAGHENYTETLKIIDLATGTQVLEGGEPGKMLLGLSQETFVSTALLRQLECSQVDGAGVNASIENLLFAANEGVNTEKAIGRLDDVRKTLLHKNGKGGEIFELEAEKLILTEKLAHAKETAESIVAKESSVEALGILEAEINIKMGECERTSKLYESCTILERFDVLHAKEAELAALSAERQALCDGKGYDGPLPTEKDPEAFENALHRLTDAAARATLAEAELARAKHQTDGDRALASLAEDILAVGGAEAVISDFSRRTTTQSKAKRRASLCLTFGISLLLIGLLALILGLSMNSPLLAPLARPAEMVRTLLLPLLGGSVALYLTLCGTLLAAGCLLTVFGIRQGLSAKEAAAMRARLIKQLSFSAAAPDEEAFALHIEACLKNQELCHTYDRGVQQAEYDTTQCREVLTKSMEACQLLLCSINVTDAQSTPEGLSEALRTAQNALTTLCRESQRLNAAMDKLSDVVAALTSELTAHDEAALRSAIGAEDPKRVLVETDIEKIELAARYYREQLAAAGSKRIGLEKELIALTAAAENPTKLAGKLAQVSALLAQKKFEHQATIMAIEAIDTASDSLRRSVTPRIRQKAGAFMSLITDGKYNELGVSADMEVNIFAGNGTRSIELLSKGTRDAAYLSLRMALADLVCPTHPLTLMMDEGLSLLDEDRAKRVLSVLFTYTQNGGQCLLFTCHKREAALMSEIGPYKHILLSPKE